MDRLEQDLRESLRRKQAPVDLAAKVLARVDTEAEARSWLSWFRVPVLAAGLAVLVMAIAAGVWAQRRHQERLAGEEARRQVVLALHIASSKLQLAETKVQQLSDKNQE